MTSRIPSKHQMKDPTSAIWQNERFRFLLVGAFNTAFGYVTFALLYLLLGNRLHYLLIGVLAHAIATLVAFTGQRRLVFRSRRPWLSEFWRFNVSLLTVLLFGLASLFVLVTLLSLHPLLGQAIVTPLSVLLSYFTHRHYSFRQP